MTKWVKYPGPGEFRGEGQWRRIEEVGMPEDEWEACKGSYFLPTHEGDGPPKDEPK